MSKLTFKQVENKNIENLSSLRFYIAKSKDENKAELVYVDLANEEVFCFFSKHCAPISIRGLQHLKDNYNIIEDVTANIEIIVNHKKEL